MSQTNDFPARADSKPADDTSEEKAGLSIALQGVQCVHLHTHTSSGLGHTNVVQVANLCNLISFLDGKVMQCSFTDFMPSHALNQQQMKSRTYSYIH